MSQNDDQQQSQQQPATATATTTGTAAAAAASTGTDFDNLNAAQRWAHLDLKQDKWVYNGDPTEASTRWFAGSHPQRLDMMLQLNAVEHFLVDGESLVIEALLNQHVDWELVQPLHVAFQAEEMLARYMRLGGNFSIVFFQHNAFWWKGRQQMRLARTLLMQRLISIADTQPEGNRFSVVLFRDYNHPTFERYVQHVAPEFMLVNDGCQFDQLLDASVATLARAQIRGFAMSLLSNRVHVAFTSRQLPWNNTVYVFAVRASADMHDDDGIAQLMTDVVELGAKETAAQRAANPAPPAPTQESTQRVLAYTQNSGTMGARDAVTLMTLAQLLHVHPDAAPLAKVHLLANAVQAMLPLNNRSLHGGKSSVVNGYLERFAAFAVPVAFGLPRIVTDMALADDFIDAVDGHLFAHVAEMCRQKSNDELKAAFGDAAFTKAAESWAVVVEVANNKALQANFAPKLENVPAVFDVAAPHAPHAAHRPVEHNNNDRMCEFLRVLEDPNYKPSANKDPRNPSGAPLAVHEHLNWKATLDGTAVVTRLDEYTEGTVFHRDPQKFWKGFMLDCRLSAESMDIKKAFIDHKDNAKDEPQHKVAQSVRTRQLEASLNREFKSSSNIYERLKDLERSADAAAVRLETDPNEHKMMRNAIETFRKDVDDEEDVSADEMKAFRELVAQSKMTEHRFLFVAHVDSTGAKAGHSGCLNLDRIVDPVKTAAIRATKGPDAPAIFLVVDPAVKLTAFRVFRRHCVLRAQQLWLLQLWCEWRRAITDGNENAACPNMMRLVELFGEFNKFMDLFARFNVAIGDHVVSSVCAIVESFNFGDAYYGLVIREIARVTGVATFRPLTINLPQWSEAKTIVNEFQSWCPARFQLTQMGERLERERGCPDPRVPFALDPWQKKLLDAVDDGYSAVVTAPTSSGKTFIAFYAMTKALRNSETDIVIYVCPNRSLVNQALGEVQARFGDKIYSRQGWNIVGVTGGGSGDHGQVVLPFKCQVLVTVPEVLEVILLSPMYQEWAKRIKFCVFDEVHSIEASDKGPVWERLMVAVPCPFVALSATLGNTDELVAWLNRVRMAKGHDTKGVVLVPDKCDPKIDRYNDIEKHVLLRKPTEFVVGRDENMNYVVKPRDSTGQRLTKPWWSRVHPMSCVNFEMLRATGAEDLRLVPQEVVELYDRMMQVLSNERYSVFVNQSPAGKRAHEALAALEPGRYFEGKLSITRTQARRFEDTLVALLVSWARATPTAAANNANAGTTTAAAGGDFTDSDCRKLVEIVNLVLESFATDVEGAEQELIDASKRGEMVHPESPEYVRKQLLPLLYELLKGEMTPLLCFTFTEEDCNRIADEMVEELETLETNFKNSPEYEIWKTNEKERYRREQEETASRAGPMMEKVEVMNADGTKSWVNQQIKIDYKEWVEPKVLPMFTLKAAMSGVGGEEWQNFLDETAFMGKTSPAVIKALERGIAIHHNDISGDRRRIIERFFRLRAVPIIICTETLALGIHSPCRTCVIAGDSARLTTDQFRQMSGRAGRRGKDYLGHCIFVGVPLRRIKRLITSDLNRLKGHVTLDPATLLRIESLFNLSRYELPGPDTPVCAKLLEHTMSPRGAGEVRKGVSDTLKMLFTEPLHIEGRSHIQQEQFDTFQRIWARHMMNLLVETGFTCPDPQQLSIMGVLAARACTSHREVYAGAGSFLFAYLLGHGHLHHASNAFDSDEQVALELQKLCSALFTWHCDFSIPLEIHDAVLENREIFVQPGGDAAAAAAASSTENAAAATAASGVPSTCRDVPHHIVLPGLGSVFAGSLKTRIADYNRLVLSAAVSALRDYQQELQSLIADKFTTAKFVSDAANTSVANIATTTAKLATDAAAINKSIGELQVQSLIASAEAANEAAADASSKLHKISDILKAKGPAETLTKADKASIAAAVARFEQVVEAVKTASENAQGLKDKATTEAAAVADAYAQLIAAAEAALVPVRSCANAEAIRDHSSQNSIDEARSAMALSAAALPLSTRPSHAFASGADNWAQNGAAAHIAHQANANVELRHPAAAISGASDVFACVDDLCRSLRDGMWVDPQMLPTLDLTDAGRHDGREKLINAAALDFLKNGPQMLHGRPTRQWLHRYNDLIPRDSWYTLTNHWKVMNNIIDILGVEFQVAPGTVEDPTGKRQDRSFNLLEGEDSDDIMAGLLQYQNALSEHARGLAFQSASAKQYQTALLEKTGKKKFKRRRFFKKRR